MSDGVSLDVIKNLTPAEDPEFMRERPQVSSILHLCDRMGPDQNRCCEDSVSTRREVMFIALSSYLIKTICLYFYALSDIGQIITASIITNTETLVSMPGVTTGWSGQKLFAAMSRSVLIAIGMFSIWWGIKTFPVFWQGADLDQMAESILDGQKFKPEILQTQLAVAASEEKPWTRPEALRSATILQLSLAEQSAPENEKPPGPIIDQLDTSVRRSLSATPADPLLWFVLFWATRMKDDRSKDNFGYLRMSYLVGPREGWVASRRNYIAFANFPDLPQDLAEAAVAEFKDLVVSEYFDTAAQILVGPGWPVHDRLLHRLEDAPDEARRGFASAVDQLGFDLSVPGVERPEPRPWR